MNPLKNNKRGGQKSVMYDIKKYTPNKKGTFLFFRKSFTKNIKKEKIDENKKANFCLKAKKNKI